MTRRFNWPIWTGFLLSFIASLSYFLFFVQFPVTRDFPWANLFLFVIAAALLVVGLRRAFAADRPHPKLSKIVASVLTLISAAICAFFLFGFFIAGRWLPASHGAPQVGQKAHEFSLADTSGRSVSLSELLFSPINGKSPKGVLLVFYRGYW
jgi:hypothetical protein